MKKNVKYWTRAIDHEYKEPVFEPVHHEIEVEQSPMLTMRELVSRQSQGIILNQKEPVYIEQDIDSGIDMEKMVDFDIVERHELEERLALTIAEANKLVELMEEKAKEEKEKQEKEKEVEKKPVEEKNSETKKKEE